MELSIISKKPVKSTDFIDLKDGTWIASLDPGNTDKILICKKGDNVSVINLKSGKPGLLMDDEELLYNLMAVDIIEIKVKEV